MSKNKFIRRKQETIQNTIILLVLILGLGYALLQQNLNITGLSSIGNPKWDIHWENVRVIDGSVEANTPEIDTAKTTVTYSVILNNPGDFYEFTVDAVNEGTIDAMIESITSKLNGATITTLPDYLEYVISYADGVSLAVNQALAAGDTETYKVTIKYRDDIELNQIPATDQTLTLQFTVKYKQADENVISRSIPGVLPNYDESAGCATISTDSSGGRGNAPMSGLTLMMKNSSLGSDANIDFTVPGTEWVDNNFPNFLDNVGPTDTTATYYTYADSYTFNLNTGKFSLTNPRVGKYSDIYASLVGKYIVSKYGSSSDEIEDSTNLDEIHKVTEAKPNYIDNSFTTSYYYSRTMNTSSQNKYYTYADSYTFNPNTGRFNLINPSVGKYSDIYATLRGKYVVSDYGSSSSTIEKSTNLSSIRKIGNDTSLSNIYYQYSDAVRPITCVRSGATEVGSVENSGVYTRAGTENDKYPIYYYRGKKDLVNNNVLFNNYCWKIVRTTATGGVRLIHVAEANDGKCDYFPVGSSIDEVIEFNSSGNDQKYAKYQYDNNGIPQDSNLKTKLENWYNTNMSNVDSKIETSIYCNDTSELSTMERDSLNFDESTIYYCPYKRAYTGNPTTLCSKKSDAYKLKVGFLTVDELVLAGRSWEYGMDDYLNDGDYYWIGTPSYFYSNYVHIFVDSYEYSVSMAAGDDLNGRPFDLYWFHPVITLLPNTSYTGTGTTTDPFVVQ